MASAFTRPIPGSFCSVALSALLISTIVLTVGLVDAIVSGCAADFFALSANARGEAMTGSADSKKAATEIAHNDIKQTNAFDIIAPVNGYMNYSCFKLR